LAQFFGDVVIHCAVVFCRLQAYLKCAQFHGNATEREAVSFHGFHAEFGCLKAERDGAEEYGIVCLDLQAKMAEWKAAVAAAGGDATSASSPFYADSTHPNPETGGKTIAKLLAYLVKQSTLPIASASLIIDDPVLTPLADLPTP
jgi:hypothetical protein